MNFNQKMKEAKKNIDKIEARTFLLILLAIKPLA